MNRIVKSAKGAISIFVALMMTGILSLGTFVLEAARLQAARTQLSEATISAATSMLSSYETDLHERYGVLAIDTQRSNEVSCRDYLDFNSDLATSVFGNNVSRLYAIEDVKMKGIYNLTYPHILKRQLLTVAKYNLVPENSQFNMYTASYALDELQMKCQYVSNTMKAIQNAQKSGGVDSLSPELRAALLVLDQTFADVKKYDEKHDVTLTGETYALLPSATGTVKSDVPAADEESVQAMLNDAVKFVGSSADVLASSSATVEETDISINMVAINEVSGYHRTSWLGELTQSEVVESIYVSKNNVGEFSGTGDLTNKYKNLADSINAAINILEGDRDGNILLNSYISQEFSNRRYVVDNYTGPGEETSEKSKSNMTFAKACTEYVFGGDSSEIKNQSKAYDYVMAVRLIGNLYAVLTESTTLDIGNVYSAAAHMAWAYYETCLDMELLTNYNTAVPLSKERMLLSINNPTEVSAAFSDRNTVMALTSMGYYNEETKNFILNGVDPLNYTDSLSLALWFVPNSEKLLRVADLMQLEMRYKQQYVEGVSATFRMSEQNTYCRVECSGKMNSVLPIVSIGGVERSLQGQPLRNVKYAGY